MINQNLLYPEKNIKERHKRKKKHYVKEIKIKSGNHHYSFSEIILLGLAFPLYLLLKIIRK